MNNETQSHYNVVIIGGGAAGLMCAIEAGKRGRSVLVLESTTKPGGKILISGGGRCNFTNLNAGPHSYVSENEHFCKSALARYSQDDFVKWVESSKIGFYEKKLGQLFCKDSAKLILKMLLDACSKANVDIRSNTKISKVTKDKEFLILTENVQITSDTLVIASGGLSIPKMGATGFGYDVAKQFGIKVTKTGAGLVPFLFDKSYLTHFTDLSGISIDAEVQCNGKSFRENILITHKGVSGPAILQISSFWRPNDEVLINLLPDLDLTQLIEIKRKENGRQEIKSILIQLLPKRFVERIFELWLKNKTLAELSGQEIKLIAAFFHAWKITPINTEGYRTAEVTVGGVDTDELSSKTFESKKVAGLYFIGEVVDVTGWLGGYNFQWAWSSGWCAGQYV